MLTHFLFDAPSVEDLGHRRYTELSDEDHQQLVDAARAGDDNAFTALVAAHLGLLSRAAHAMVQAGAGMDDARTCVVTAAWTALAHTDDARGYAHALSRELGDTRDEQAALTCGPVSLPARRVREYRQAIALAEGDLTRARRVYVEQIEAGSAEAWDSLTSALHGRVDFEATTTFGGACHDGFEEVVESRVLVHMALRGLDQDDADLVRRLFGFDGFPEMTTAEVADALGVTERTVFNRRRRALERLSYLVNVAA